MNDPLVYPYHDGQSLRGERQTIDNWRAFREMYSHMHAAKLMSDITLVVGGVEHPSHRLVLCAHSDVFLAMMSSPAWREGKASRIVLHEEEGCRKVFGVFLKYLYTAQICLESENIVPVVSLADKYNIKDLFKIGLRYMADNVNWAFQNGQLVSWFRCVIGKGNESQVSFLTNLIKHNFQKFAFESQDFPDLSCEELLTFIQCDDLVIHDEMSLFKCVHKWLTVQRERISTEVQEDTQQLSELIKRAKRLLAHVRFPMMSLSQLKDLDRGPSWEISKISEQHKYLWKEQVGSALVFHRHGLADSTANVQLGSVKPRLYTSNCLQRCQTQIWGRTVDKWGLDEHKWDVGRPLYFSSKKYSAEHLGEELFDWTLSGCWCDGSGSTADCIHPPLLPVMARRLTRHFTVSIRMGGRPTGEAECEQVHTHCSQRTPQVQERRVQIAIVAKVDCDGFQHVVAETANHHFAGDDGVFTMSLENISKYFRRHSLGNEVMVVIVNN